jgi:hypothetical protein
MATEDIMPARIDIRSIFRDFSKNGAVLFVQQIKLANKD